MKYFKNDEELKDFMEYFKNELPDPEHHPIKVMWLVRWWKMLQEHRANEVKDIVHEIV
tara:strand:- start:84 stop:257 length:174 start_codon:yes stop_codon:yes gene_type:complete